MDAAVELLNGILQKQVKPFPVPIFKEDRDACITVKDDMIDGALVVDTRFFLAWVKNICKCQKDNPMVDSIGFCKPGHDSDNGIHGCFMPLT